MIWVALATGAPPACCEAPPAGSSTSTRPPLLLAVRRSGEGVSALTAVVAPSLGWIEMARWHLGVAGV